MLYRLRTVSATRFAVLLGLLLVALHPWLWLVSYAGLETPLYMLLILEMAICVHRAPAASALWVYALFLLLPLTRPEGIVFASLGVALFRYRRGSAPKHGALFAVALLLGILYFLVRWRYFHHLLPNPYYFKLGHSTGVEIRSSFLENLTDFKGYILVLVLIAALAQRFYTRIFAVGGTLLLLSVYAPHIVDVNYADRFYFQVVFPLLLLFLMTEDLARMARAAAVVATLCLFSINLPFLVDALLILPYWIPSDIDLGRQLAPFAGNHTLLTGDGGAIPYYSNWTVYDYQGLGTYGTAKNGLSVATLRQLNPDLLLIEGVTPGPAVLDEAPQVGTRSRTRAEIAFLRQSADYECVGASDYQNIYLVEFLRKDTPQHDKILRALERNTQTSAAARWSFKDLLLQRYVLWRE
jgi:hypothetical protein